MGNCFFCCRGEEDHFDDGAPKCDEPSNVILVQEKNTFAGKDGEGETTSKAENKCQPKTELEKSTSEMQKAENLQETVKVIQDNLDKEKCVEDNLDTQKDVEDNFDAKQKGESLEMPCSNEEHLSVETNIVDESAFDRAIEDQPQETGLANGADEKMSELNQEDFERKSQSEIPFENGDSSAETNIAGENAADIQVEDEPKKTELASANVQSCSRNAEFEKEDILADVEIVVTIMESQDKMEEDNFVAKDVGIEENVGETTFEMSSNISGQDNNEIEIEKELRQASSAEENVPNEQESEEDTSEDTSNEEDNSISEGEIELEESSGDTGRA